MNRRACRARRSHRAEPLERRLLMAIDVDPSFGDAGIARIDTGVNGLHATVMVRQLTDGQILTVTGVGFAQAQGGTDVNAAVARFTADGLPDTTFGGGDGVELHDVAGGALTNAGDQDEFHAGAVDTRGERVVVVGVGGTNPALDTDGLVYLFDL